MNDPKHLHDHARKCRALLRTAREPGVIEQLRVWSVELAEEADEAERRKAGDGTIGSDYDLRKVG
jgi:hypothetical protein